MLKHLICALLGLTLGMAPVSDMQRVFFESEAIAFQEDAELMTLRVCPILGADCMLLTLGEHSMLIDAGRNTHAKTILGVLQEAGLDSVEYAFNSHPHPDHIGGIIPLMEAGLGIGTFFTLFPHDYLEKPGDYGYQATTIRALEDAGIPVVDLSNGDTIPFGDAEVQVIRIPDSYIEGRERTCNDLSAMLMIRYGECSVLLTADIEPNDQKLLAEIHDLKADILKYPHHGESLLTLEFMEDVDPEFFFFTHSAGNTHDAQKHMAEHGYDRMMFATWGTIIMETDGSKWLVRQELLPEYEKIAEEYTYGK